MMVTKGMAIPRKRGSTILERGKRSDVIAMLSDRCDRYVQISRSTARVASRASGRGKAYSTIKLGSE